MLTRLAGVLAVGAVVTWAAAEGVAASSAVLRLATTTSTENSGLLAHIHPDFEKKTGIKVQVIAKGTGASLQLGRDGNVDVVLVHAPEAEAQFVSEGYGVMRRDVMYNDFVIIGPAADPAGVRGSRGPGEALRRIASRGHVFVSRGDNSGTHMKEQELWRLSGVPLERARLTSFVEGKETTFESVRPVGDWYLSIGQGMGKAILVATEKEAYTLADRGTYWSFAGAEPPRTDLALLYEGHKSLHNPYGVIAVNPRKHPGVNIEGARRYIEWITSPEVQAMIGGYRVGGRELFHPSAGGEQGR